MHVTRFMKTLTETIIIKKYETLKKLAEQIVNERVESQTAAWRNERFTHIQDISKKGISAAVKENLTNEEWFEIITWEEIRKTNLNNWKKNMKKRWKKILTRVLTKSKN